MKCPMCGGDFDTATFKTLGGSAAQARHCMQCGGFWFERPLDEPLAPFSVSQYDAAAPNYSLKQIDLVCPNDQSLLSEVDDPDQPAGTQFWQCSDCDGCFYPRGQLAHVTNWQATTVEVKTPIVSRSRSALAVLLMVFGAVVVNLTVQKLGTLEAFGEQVSQHHLEGKHCHVCNDEGKNP